MLLAIHWVPAIALGLGEEGAVAHRLNNQEHDVEEHGNNPEQNRLVWRFDRIRRRLRVVRDDEREHGERGNHHEESARRRDCIPAPNSAALP